MEPILRSAQALKQEAEEIGFEGKDILEYVKEQQKLDREERAAWREAQKMQAQADVELAKIRAEAEAEERKRADQAEEKRRADEIRFAQIEAAKEQAKLEAEKELKIKEMELQAQAQVTASSATTPPPRNKDAKSPKLPSFIDEKDELDSYLLRFERYAENASWEKDTWAIKLSALLTGRAMDVYTRMSDADASDYDKLKKALLTRYNYTEDGYRKRFREATPETEETPDQFVIRLKNYLAKWLELSGSSPDNFDALVDLIVKEQFINACSEDLAMYLLERGPKDLVELTTWAQKYLIAHKEQLGKSKATVQPRRVDQKKTTQSKPDPSQGRQRSLQCYRCRGFGHMQSECGTKISPGKDQKGSSTPVSQSSQKKTRAMVAQLDEDGEKAFTCVEVEGTRSRSNSKKSGTEGSTNSDRAVYSAVCRAQSNDGQTYVGVGKLNGRPVKVLRDTGCTGMIVDRALVPEVLVIPGSSGSLQMVDHTLIDVPLANVYLDSPYYKGHCRVMCVSSPVYPVIIGNVRGARRMLPDPDWKAEDQPGVRARTSGGNKDKDNEDNQGGDIPAWMFRRSNQKTEKSAPKERDSKKKPAQPKENDDRARRNVKVKEGATDEKCVAGPVVTRAQAKKSDKVHPLKVKEAMSSVDKLTIENLQKKDSTLKKCFDRIGKPIIRENYVGEFYKKNGLLYRKHQETKTGRSFNQLVVPKELRRQVMSVNHESAFSGHLGAKKTEVRILPNFFWPGLHQDVDPELGEVPDLEGYRQREGVRDVKLGDELPEDQRRVLKDLVRRYPDVFTDMPGETDVIQHQIRLTDDTPIRCKPYPLPYAMREELRNEVDTMLEMGVVRPSTSPYASPIVMVKKKDGSNRVCVDFRKLNKITEVDPEPMTTAEDLFRRLSGKKYLSKIDLTKGYWQIPVAPEDVHKTAFVTPDGQYEFTRMPFGMVNSGATLVRGLRKILEGMPGVGSYVDDIVIYSDNWEDHVKTLKELFGRLRKARITARPTKCLLGASRMEFLGHQVGGDIITPSRDNLEKVRNTPRPTTKKQVRSFLGLVGYYRDHIPAFAEISAPLTDLLKKGKAEHIQWSEAQERAYSLLKEYLLQEPVLKLPDLSKPFVLRTDASGVGVAAVLLQENDGKLYPVGYASKKLNLTEARYPIIEKECLAVVWGIKRFKLYLAGRRFTLQTDHKPLKYLKDASYQNDRVFRWAVAVQEYSFKVEDIPGRENIGADFLSRTGYSC